jgi:hypothetical protein
MLEDFPKIIIDEDEEDKEDLELFPGPVGAPENSIEDLEDFPKIVNE